MATGPATNAYTSQSAVGFNDSPPVDDGSTTEANRLTYAKIKTKLADPVKTLADNIDTQNRSAFGKTINTDNDERNVIGGAIAFASSELTIASGVVTQTRGFHTIDTESDASTDDLDRLAPTSTDDGAICILAQEASGRDVTVKHQGGAGDGQFVLTNSEDYTIGTNGRIVLQWDNANSQWVEISRSSAATAAPRSYLAGLAISNNSGDANKDIDTAAGVARNSDNTDTLALGSTLVKQLDAAFAVGTNAGGLDTGAVAADTWYHVHLIKRTDTGVVDALFSTSATAPTMPTNYDKRRRIGAVLTDSSSNILAFTQVGDHFVWANPNLDINSTTLGTSVASFTLSVPLGVTVWADYNFQLNAGETALVYLKSPDANDEAPADGTAPLSNMKSNTASTGQNLTRTNTSSQINARASAANVDIDIATLGWYDRRGRDA